MSEEQTTPVEPLSMDNLTVIVPLHGFATDREKALEILLNTVEAQDLPGFDFIVVEQRQDRGASH
jgi:hypothetical protein